MSVNKMHCSGCCCEIILSLAYEFSVKKQYYRMCGTCYSHAFELIDTEMLGVIADKSLKCGAAMFKSMLKEIVDSGKLGRFSVMCRLASPSTWGSV